MSRVHKKGNIFDFINILIMLFICVITLYPFLYLLAVSFSRISDVITSDILIFPKNPTLESYKYVFSTSNIRYAYQNTLFITLMGTLFNLVMTSLGAFALSQKSLPGRKIITGFIVLTMIFNAGLIPVYIVVRNLRLLDSLWALIIPNGINTFYMLIMRNFLSSIPDSLSESARIDGASEIRILVLILLPLSKPILATLALFYGVNHWNQYFSAVIYLNNQMKMPLQVIVRSMYQERSVLAYSDAHTPPVETIRAATVMAATLPILCVYPFLQKYFVSGMMVGAVKG